MRASLAEEALRLGRRLAQLLPDESEIYALLALMELQASRNVARRGTNGEAVLLPDQNRSLWDDVQIQQGMASLEHAQETRRWREIICFAGSDCGVSHAGQHSRTDRLGADRSSLQRSGANQPSPIAALNRAVAVGMAQGPSAGLDALDAAATLAGDSALAGYHLLPTVRGDLLMKMGRFTEAREEIQRAIAMTRNLRKQELLADRLKQIEKAVLSA
jgi:RNA polymerase sigma-70 factor, ECF subfamily